MPKRPLQRKRKLAPRIISVCVEGKPARKPKHNKRRGRALLAIVRSVLAKDWGRIDAVLLPGGYFHLAKRISKLEHNARVAALQRERSFPAMKKASQSLSRQHPGAALVLGLDSKPRGKGHSWDQVCIALRGGKIVAVAPKIFPTKGDGRDDGSVIVPNADDYGSDRRYVDLPSGHRALLCTCYDTFGVAEAVNGPGRRANLIRWLYTKARGRHRVRGRDTVVECLTAWKDAVRRNRPSVVLSAIHVFAAPGREGYWQRHGISAASAALNGALSIGAAHFKRLSNSRLKSSLADFDVPTAYLGRGTHRPLRACKMAGSLHQSTSFGAAIIRISNQHSKTTKRLLSSP
jgi:hypothetical protein